MDPTTDWRQATTERARSHGVSHAEFQEFKEHVHETFERFREDLDELTDRVAALEQGPPVGPGPATQAKLTISP